MTVFPNYAGGFLYNPKDKTVLLHLRDGNTKIAPNMWSFFGGLCEGEETPVQGFVREMKEELNIELPETSVIPLRSYLNEKLQTLRHVFYMESDLEKSQMTLGEGAGFDWIPLESVFTYDLTDKAREDLQFFLTQNPV
jgi:8-oxo-dGTP pyrophosphatase MutT (NUDIX family)